MTKKYLTAVFEYEDGAELPKALTEAFASETMKFQDTRITAVSMGDEILRCEQLEQQLDA